MSFKELEFPIATVFEKLNLKEQSEILVLNAPKSFEPEMNRLRNVSVARQARELKELSFSLAFVTKLKEVERVAKLVASKSNGDAVVWLAYPKQTSKSFKCEFNRDTGWVSLGEAGFEGVRQVAIDDDWSAIRFRRVEFIGKMIRDKKRAMTRQGRARTAKR